MARKPWFYDVTSLRKLRFTKNEGYGWKALRMLSSKMVEMAGKLARDGQKMATTVAAMRDHVPPTSLVVHRSTLRLQGSRSPVAPLPSDLAHAQV